MSEGRPGDVPVTAGDPVAEARRVPLLTLPVCAVLLAARDAGHPAAECSLDLGRTTMTVAIHADGFTWEGQRFPYPDACRDHTVCYWDGRQFAPVARYSRALYKLIPTAWGPPTFEIDGIKMLPTATVSPWEDARAKVALVQPRGKRILDTCGGLGYFAAWCLAGGASHVRSFEKSADVLWLRNLNPWSPGSPWSLVDGAVLALEVGDISERIAGLATGSFDAILHDPPRFAIAGELYARSFYDQLARVLRPGGRLFHYTGAPNQRSRGRDLPREVAARLQAAGFRVRLHGDGVLARREHR
jgi:predicted methyltransferase